MILLEVPPLRERREDIVLLANHYLKYFSDKNRKKIDSVAPEALSALSQYDWPGNVRELKNIMERVAVLSRSNTIAWEQLPDDIRRKDKLENRQSSAAKVKNSATIQEMEQEMIRRTLIEANRNKSLAAKKLGISRRTLYRKLAEYKISE